MSQAVVPRQFIPSHVCQGCEVCCRFRTPGRPWVPCGVRDVIPARDFYLCPHLSQEGNLCLRYDDRPFECSLYPFLIRRIKDKVWLSLDNSCPYARARQQEGSLGEFCRYLKDFLGEPKTLDFLKANLSLIDAYEGDITDIEPLEIPALNPLRLEDKDAFADFLGQKTHELSHYSFASIYIWKDTLSLYWQIIEGCLCIFARDEVGCFMPLPPLGEEVSDSVVGKCFAIMDFFNVQQAVSRLENAETPDVEFYRQGNFKIYPKDPEYLYASEDLIGLRGDRFKTKRWSCNVFAKNHRYSFLKYDGSQEEACWRILQDWFQGRREKSTEPIYRGMLQDFLVPLKIILKDGLRLGLEGRVIEVDGRVAGFSFGFGLYPETFCILCEIVDLGIKGLSQFIFRRMAEEFRGFTYINAMDDSGLESLRRQKLSYRPVRQIPSFVIARYEKT